MNHAAGENDFRKCSTGFDPVGGEMLFDVEEETFDPVFSPLSDRAGVDDNLVGFFPRQSFLITAGLVVSGDSFRVRLVRLTAKGLDEIRRHYQTFFFRG